MEEQFYLFFPWLLIIIHRVARRHVSRILAICALLSFGLAVWATWTHPTAAFYSLPTPFWELLLGSKVALQPANHPLNSKILLGSVMSLVGLAAILVPVFFFGNTTSFSGFAAALPSVGADLLIFFANPGTITHRWLSGKWLVSIGLISYSAYLIHQPLFAAARHFQAAEPSKSIMVLLVIITLILAYISWRRYCERLFRDCSLVSFRTLFSVLGLATILLGGFGAAVLVTRGYSFRASLPPNVQWRSLGDRLSAEGNVCEVVAVKGYDGLSSWAFGNRNSSKTIVLYGELSRSEAPARTSSPMLRIPPYRP